MQRHVLAPAGIRRMRIGATLDGRQSKNEVRYYCLLYTSDAADERSSVDLGGRRIIKKKKERVTEWATNSNVACKE